MSAPVTSNRLTRGARQGLVVALLGSLASVAVAGSPTPRSAPTSDVDGELARRAELSTLERVALGRSPALRAAEHRARASEAMGRAEDRLPPPVARAELWQVPIARPYAVADAGMLMVGVEQEFPAAGGRTARAAAHRAQSSVERAQRDVLARAIARDVEHAFADYLEATARHRIHVEHSGVARRALGLAQARLSAGAGLAEAAQAEVELATSLADIATDETRVKTARVRLNGLLARRVGAALGAPVDHGPQAVKVTTEELIASAVAHRPELRERRAQRAVESAELRGAESEATTPSFSVGALYFAPVGPMPQHGFGASFSMSLPWLSGGAAARGDVRRSLGAAADADAEQIRLVIATEVSTAQSAVESAVARLRALAEHVVPASRRAVQASLSGYESGQVQLALLLGAERGLVDGRMQVVMARAALDHALAELDFATGARVPRVALTLEDAR